MDIKLMGTFSIVANGVLDRGAMPAWICAFLCSVWLRRPLPCVPRTGRRRAGTSARRAPGGMPHAEPLSLRGHSGRAGCARPLDAVVADDARASPSPARRDQWASLAGAIQGISDPARRAFANCHALR